MNCRNLVYCIAKPPPISQRRAKMSTKQLATYLNQLLGRTHNLIYLGHKPKVSGIVGFYRDTYPRIFRETLPQTLLAFAIFAVAGIVAWAVTWHDSAFAYRVLGPRMMETIEQRKMWTESIVTVKPLASSGIMTNNLSVAFSTFAMGITAGIGTIWMMAVNGLLIGVIGAATWKAGMAYNCGVSSLLTGFWSCRRSSSPAARDWK